MQHVVRPRKDAILNPSGYGDDVCGCDVGGNPLGRTAMMRIDTRHGMVYIDGVGG